MTANRVWNPEAVAGPFGAYSHCCEISAGARLLTVAGQVGVTLDGKIAQGIDAQCEWALKNVRAILQANDMRVEHITKLGIFLLDREHVPMYRAAREKVLGDVRPPGTLVIVSGLVNPEWLVEIEAYAAKPQ